MDASELRDELEDEYETELSRLGSSKAMYAVTEGEMETDAVLESMADRAAAAAATFEAWADDGGETAETFGDAAAQQREHVDRIAGNTGYDPEPTSAPLYEHLQDLDTPPERAAGLVAWALIEDRTLSQAVGFFVGNAATTEADLFRDLRSETRSRLDAAIELLDDVVGDDEWETAHAAASAAVEAAYSHYVSALESMGIKVKPVC